MSPLLTGVIFSTGISLGIGIGLLLGIRPLWGRRMAGEGPPPKSEPLTERLRRLEAYVEAAGQPAPEPERHAAAVLDLVKRSDEKLRRELPALIEAGVTARVTELDTQFPAHPGNGSVERLIAERVGPLEKVLVDQASRIDALRAHSGETDVNLQRLIVSIDRLCEISPVAPVTTQPAPVLKAPVMAGPPAVEIARFVKESEAEPGKPRILMARIFGALLVFGVSRFLP